MDVICYCIFNYFCDWNGNRFNPCFDTKMKPDKWAEKEAELIREIENIRIGAIRVESPIFAKLPLIKLDQLRECWDWHKKAMEKRDEELKIKLVNMDLPIYLINKVFEGHKK